MFKTFEIRYKCGAVITWLGEASVVMQSLRTQYPDVTLVRLNAQSYLATFKGTEETIMGTPRSVAEQVLLRDPKVVSVDWGDMEELI